MRQRFLSDEEISNDLDQQVDEIIQIAEGPSGLAENIGRQNPLKSVEQALMPAPPTQEKADPEFRPLMDGFEPGSIFINDHKPC